MTVIQDPIDERMNPGGWLTCTQKTKDGVCGKPAVAMMFWPGSNPLPVCEQHQQKGKVTAEALGFVLRFEEIPR